MSLQLGIPGLRLRPLLAACALVAASGVQAALTPPAGGGVADYGNGGNLFEVLPFLYVQGLGGANIPESVVVLNPLLSYTSSDAGWGSSLLTFDYRVHNSSTTQSFHDLRFMVFANPDGGPNPFLDTISESWGPDAAGEPVMREVREFSFNPNTTIVGRFLVNNNLSEGVAAIDAGCMGAAGCDATAGLQWNAANLGPGQTFRVLVGMSDDGQSLSKRWIDAKAVDSPNTSLRISGLSSIIPVPEPATYAMLLAGLAVVGAIGTRQRRRSS